MDRNSLSRRSFVKVTSGMNVVDNCTLAPVTLKRMSKAEAERVALEHLDSVGLSDFTHGSPAGEGGRHQDQRHRG